MKSLNNLPNFLFINILFKLLVLGEMVSRERDYISESTVGSTSLLALEVSEVVPNKSLQKVH
jgi:hypothetical protein